MNTFSNNTDLNVKLNNIFKNRFDIDLFNNNLNLDIDDNLLQKKFKLRSRDLIYLLYDIEEEFDITVSEYAIDNIQFNTLRNIINIINAELQKKEQKVI